MPVHPDVQAVLYDAAAIRRRVQELGAEITRDYAGQEVHLIGVLRGAGVFLADLARELQLPVTLDYLAVRSYGSGATTSGVVRMTKDLEDDIEGRQVLLIEDVVDSGLTLEFLVDTLRHRRAASVEVCALLDKPSGRKIEIAPRYVGFTAPPGFVVGYGLDYAQRYRELPYLGILRPEIYGGG